MAQPRLPIMLAAVGDKVYFRPLESVRTALTNGALKLTGRELLQEAQTVAPDTFLVEPQEGHAVDIAITIPFAHI